MSNIKIRQATPDDAPLLHRFVRELAIYENAEDQMVSTVEMIRESLFGADSTTRALVCELDGEAVGHAFYFFNYSTWMGRHGLYLEDLYVVPEHRGSGAGTALLKHLARIAIERGCARFEWSCLDWNEPAIQFYQSLGAKPQEEWVIYRLSGQALVDFAAH